MARDRSLFATNLMRGPRKPGVGHQGEHALAEELQIGDKIWEGQDKTIKITVHNDFLELMRHRHSTADIGIAGDVRIRDSGTIDTPLQCRDDGVPMCLGLLYLVEVVGHTGLQGHHVHAGVVLFHTDERDGVSLTGDDHHHGVGFDGFTELRCYPLRPSTRRRGFGVRRRINKCCLGFLDGEAQTSI